MGRFEQIEEYDEYLTGKNGKIKTPKPKHGMIYTCNCGWIDAEHIEPDYVRDVILKPIFSDQPDFAQNGDLGTRVKLGRAIEIWGPIKAIDVNLDYFVKAGLSTAQKEQAALALFKDFQNKIETQQGTGLTGVETEYVGGATSFSEEDLVSDLVGFYDGLRRTDWHDLCKPVSVDESKKIFNRDGIGMITRHLGKNMTFNPVYHQCGECTSRNFPAQYQTIADVEKGDLFRDFDAGRSVPANQYQLFFGFSRNSQTGLFLQGIPGKIPLVVKDKETQYDFCYRALKEAARQAGIADPTAQGNYAGIFYPLVVDLNTENTFQSVWVGGDKNGKNVGKMEFNNYRGKSLNYK